MFVKTRRRSIVDLDDDITWGTDHGRFNHSRMTSIIRLLRQVVQPYTCNVSIGKSHMDQPSSILVNAMLSSSTLGVDVDGT